MAIASSARAANQKKPIAVFQKFDMKYHSAPTFNISQLSLASFAKSYLNSLICSISCKGSCLYFLKSISSNYSSYSLDLVKRSTRQLSFINLDMISTTVRKQKILINQFLYLFYKIRKQGESPGFGTGLPSGTPEFIKLKDDTKKCFALFLEVQPVSGCRIWARDSLDLTLDHGAMPVGSDSPIKDLEAEEDKGLIYCNGIFIK